MKIVTLGELRKMPKGTVYAMWSPCVMSEEVCMKITEGGEWTEEAEMFPLNFFYKDDKEYSLEENSYEKDELCLADGCWYDYKDEQLFIVFSQDDIDYMIMFLEKAIGYRKDEETE